MSEVGIWSIDKYNLIGKYIETYSKIVGSAQFQNIAYIDGFAGCGYHTIKGTDIHISGSPIIAWNSIFKEYHFIDSNSDKLDELKTQLLELGINDKKVYFHPFDSNDMLPIIFNKLKIDHSSWRALCLLDPYGANISWDTIQQASNIIIHSPDKTIIRPIEFIIHFSMLSLQRNAMPKDRNKLTKKNREYYRKFFGNDSWEEEIYQKEASLFSDYDIYSKRYDSEERILRYYVKRLKDVGYNYVNPSPPLKNSMNATLYYLIFASSHPAGNKLASSIISSLEKQNG